MELEKMLEDAQTDIESCQNQGELNEKKDRID